MTEAAPASECILVLAPSGRDAPLARAILENAGMTAAVCRDLAVLCEEIDAGAGAAIIADEALASGDLRPLNAWLDTQPPWSDFPLVVLTRRGPIPEIGARASRLRPALGNVTYLERPFHPDTLVGALQAALRGRRRQYQARAHLQERERAAEALRASEERYRFMAESIPQIVWTAKPDGSFDYFNHRWVEYTGLSMEETLDWGWKGCPHPDDLQPTIDAWTAALRTGREYKIEHRLRRRDGQYRWLLTRAVPLRDALGNIVKWFGTTTDIHDRKTVEERIRQSEQRYRTLVAATTAGVWTTGPEGSFDEPQQAWGAFTGQPWEEQRGFGWIEALHPDDRQQVRTSWERARAERSIYESEGRLWHAPSGSYRSVLARAAPLLNPDGTVREWIGMITDVTERVEAEARRQLLLHELNHRVKNTLATVQAIAVQTLRSAASPEAFREAFEARLLALSETHNLLTQGSWQGADLREVVLAELAPHFDHYEPRFTLHGGHVHLGPKAAVALGMAFHELVTNAAKYGALSVPSGRVAVIWGVRATADGRWLRLDWLETGGPTVAMPRRKGFGSRLIEQGLAHELAGEVRLDFAPAGVRCTMELPLAWEAGA